MCSTPFSSIQCIVSEDIPGWLVTNEGTLTVALDITITDELRNEGVARELVNRIQNIRKDSGFEVTDKINIQISANDYSDNAIVAFKQYIAGQTLANSIDVVGNLNGSAFGEGIDCIKRRVSFVVKQSVSLILPSEATNFNP